MKLKYEYWKSFRLLDFLLKLKFFEISVSTIKSKFANLSPFMDDQGLIRVRDSKIQM